MRDVRRAARDLAEPLDLALVDTDERVEPVDRRAVARHRAESRRLHVRDRHITNRLSLRLRHALEQHEHVCVGRFRDDLLRAVGDLPLLRKVDAESERRMQEGTATRHALLGVVADRSRRRGAARGRRDW